MEEKLVGGRLPEVHVEEFTSRIRPEVAAANRARLVREFKNGHRPVFRSRRDKSGK